MRKGEVKQIEFTGQNVLVMRDAQSALAAGATQVLVTKRCIITPSARDFLRQNEIEIVVGGTAASGSNSGASSSSSPVQATRSPANPKLFTTPEAEAVKKEICAVGRKLWHRGFVDGNGGNISYRIGPNEVLCSPTLVSKFDLTPEDLCLVDLDGAESGERRNQAVIKRIAKEVKVPIQTGGGIRNIEVVDDYLSAGIARVVNSCRVRRRTASEVCSI